MARASEQRPVGFIGGGNMAEALVRGLIASGRSPTAITVAEPVGKRRSVLARRYRVKVTADNRAAVEQSSVVVIAVKPQVIGAVLDELREHLTRRHVVVSIAAGVTLARLRDGLGADARIVRVMPNTPCLIGRGATVVCGGEAASKSDVRLACGLFATVGRAHQTDDERLMDAVTGLSGSGPAYVYLFAEALIQGGVRGGLDRKLAAELAYETIAGAAEMMIRTGQTPASLREAVTSPGGTTRAGLDRLAKGKFAATVTEGVVAATRRSRELGRRKP